VKPLVTVLILTYNHEKFIAQAVDSVLMQRVNFDIEVLVGNDASTDGTAAILDTYNKQGKNDLRIINHSANLGGLKNEQMLFENAKGKYICFLEGDDYWTDDLKLQKQVDFLEANSGYGMVHADVDHFYEVTGDTETHVNRKNQVRMPEGSIFNDLMKPEPVFIKTATVCFRKELVEKHFDYSLAIKDHWPLTDFPLWLDIAAHSNVHYMDEVFATYRLLNESASRTRSPEKKLKFHKGLYRIKRHYGSKYKLDEQIIHALEETYHRGLIRIAFNLNDKTIAGDALAFLKHRHYRIELKERIMVLATKHPFMFRLLKFGKP
jgi:glycosyltransferase involved in cell wall biosynthesis